MIATSRACADKGRRCRKRATFSPRDAAPTLLQNKPDTVAGSASGVTANERLLPVKTQAKQLESFFIISSHKADFSTINADIESAGIRVLPDDKARHQRLAETASHCFLPSASNASFHYRSSAVGISILKVSASPRNLRMEKHRRMEGIRFAGYRAELHTPCTVDCIINHTTRN